jgi:ribosomal protein S3AE
MAQSKKKKKFWEVEMPIIKKSTQLYAYTIEDLKNKIIQYDLTRILKGKSALLNLKVKINEGKATSTPIQLKLMSSFLKRMMRKGIDYVEDSFSLECKDAKIKIKSFLITRKKVKKRIKKAIRDKTRQEIIKEFKKENVEKIFESILKNKFQKELSLKIKKIYPLSLCEIKFLKIEKFL